MKKSLMDLSDDQVIRAFVALADIADCRDFERSSGDWTEAGPDIGEVLGDARETIERQLAARNICTLCFGQKTEDDINVWRCHACDPLSNDEKIAMLMADVRKIGRLREDTSFEDIRRFLSTLPLTP